MTKLTSKPAIRKATQKNEHGGSSVIAALIANFLVFLFKLIAALIGKSSSMLAESVHSFADCGNELMLIFGKRFRKSMILMSAIPKAGQTFVMFPA